MANDLQALEAWAAPLLAKLEAKERRALARSIARDLRRHQRERIRAQRELFGFTEADRQHIRDSLIDHLMPPGQ